MDDIGAMDPTTDATRDVGANFCTEKDGLSVIEEA